MKKIFSNLKPLIPLIVLVIIFIIAQSVINILIPLQNIPLASAIAINDTAAIWKITITVLLYALGIAILGVATMYLSAKIGAGFSKRLREMIFTKVQSLSVAEIENFGTASLITRTTNDVMQMQVAVIMFIRIVFTTPIMLIGGFIASLSVEKSFSFVYLAAIPLIAIILVFIIIKGSKLFISVQKKLDNLTVVARENLTGVRVIRAFNREEFESKKFNEANADLTDNSIKVNRLMATLFPSNMWIMNMTTVVLVLVSALVFNGLSNPVKTDLYANVGATSAVVNYAGMILGSIIGMAFLFMLLPRAAASANRIAEVLNSVPTIFDPEAAVISSSSEIFHSQKGKVEFRNVSFSFPGAEKPLLQNLSFTALPGKTTAIIGSTGSGKSTVANLIPRFYDVSEGEVLVNGVNVKDVSQKQLREKIGFVTQNALLFSGTVRQNIEGSLNLSDKEIMRAAKIAQVKDLIENTDNGLNHYIAQGGKNLSGGQKQRLTIARAIAKKPDIYVFDDSFSALDFATDKKLRAALKKEISNSTSTIIIVAQRVSTILNADQILVMDNGQMLCSGTHKELMECCETYREIVLSQIDEEEAA